VRYHDELDLLLHVFSRIGLRMNLSLVRDFWYLQAIADNPVFFFLRAFFLLLVPCASAILSCPTATENWNQILICGVRVSVRPPVRQYLTPRHLMVVIVEVDGRCA